MGHDLETTPGGHTPNPDRESGDRLDHDVAQALEPLLELVGILTDGSNVAPNVRVGGHSLGALAGLAANVWSALTSAGYAYHAATGRPHPIPPGDPCPYCHGNGELLPVYDPVGALVPCRVCSGTGKVPWPTSLDHVAPRHLERRIDHEPCTCVNPETPTPGGVCLRCGGRA